MMKVQEPRHHLRLLLEEVRNSLNPLDYRFAAEISYGVCRRYYSLFYRSQQLLKKPLAQKHQDLLLCLMMGLYELEYTRVPAYATLNEIVALSQHLGKPWASSFLNACLRSYRHHSVKIAPQQEEAYYDHPLWFINEMKQQYPAYWREILANNNLTSPLVIRIKRPPNKPSGLCGFITQQCD